MFAHRPQHLINALSLRSMIKKDKSDVVSKHIHDRAISLNALHALYVATDPQATVSQLWDYILTYTTSSGGIVACFYFRTKIISIDFVTYYSISVQRAPLVGLLCIPTILCVGGVFDMDMVGVTPGPL